MFCAFCGKQISDTAKFCPGCGKATGIGTPASAPTPAPAPAPVSQPQPQSQSGFRCHVCGEAIPFGDTCPRCGAKLAVPGPGTTWADVMEAEKRAKAKKARKAWLIVGCVLGGLVALALIALLVTRLSGIGGETAGAAPGGGEVSYFEGMNRGGDAYNEGDYETALEYYLAALDSCENEDEELRARVCLAGAYYALGDYDNCMEMSHSVLETDAEVVEGYLFLADCYCDTGDPEAALETLYLGLGVDSDYEPFLERIARLEEELGIDATPEAEPAPDAEWDGTLVRLNTAEDVPFIDFIFVFTECMMNDMGVALEEQLFTESAEVLMLAQAGEDYDLMFLAMTPEDYEDQGLAGEIFFMPVFELDGQLYGYCMPADRQDLYDFLMQAMYEAWESGLLEEKLIEFLPGAAAAW